MMPLSHLMGHLHPGKKNPGLLGIILKKPGFGGNESAGARTQDPGIKSPLLYQLSYALILPNSTQVGGIP